MIREEISRHKLDVCKVKGYTSHSTTFGNVKVVFRASPCCHGGPWYDWGYVEYAVQSKKNGPVRATYPSKILNFVMFSKDKVRTAIITSSRSVPLERCVQDFNMPFCPSYNKCHNYAFVPLSAILFPLLVFSDLSGSDNKLFCVIPKRNWGDRFDNKIVVSDAGHESVMLTDVDDRIGATTERSVNK